MDLIANGWVIVWGVWGVVVIMAAPDPSKRARQ
jgi:hypothetical protein